MGVGLRVEWRDYKWFDERMSGRWMYDEDSLSFQIEVAIRGIITCDIEKDDTSGLRDLVRGSVENVIQNFNTKFNGIVIKTITGVYQEQSYGMVMKTVKERNPNWFNFNRVGGECDYYCHLHIDKVIWAFNQIETRNFVSLEHNCNCTIYHCTGCSLTSKLFCTGDSARQPDEGSEARKSFDLLQPALTHI